MSTENLLLNHIDQFAPQPEGMLGRLSFAWLIGLPRPEAKLSWNGCRRRFYLTLFLSLFSFLLMVMGLNDYLRLFHQYSSLNNQGNMAVGVVTDLEVEQGNNARFYRIVYQFMAPVGGVYTGFNAQARVPADLYPSLGVGQEIEIIYLPANPLISFPKAALKPPTVTFPLLFISVGAVLMFIGISQFNRARAVLAERKKVERQGLTTEAVIFDKWSETNVVGDRLDLIAYAYEISTPRGPQRITRAEVNPKAHRALGLGDHAKVKYLPNDPEASFLVDYP